MTKARKIIIAVAIIVLIVLFFIVGTIINMDYNNIRGIVISVNDIKHQEAYNCPSNLNFNPILSEDGTTYDETKIKFSFKQSDIDVNDIYVVDYLYLKDKNGLYSFDEGKVQNPTDENKVTKDGSIYYEFTLSNLNYRKIVIYSGSTLCNEYYFASNNVNIDDLNNKYDFSKYVIVTKEGLLFGNTAKITSDSEAFKIGEPSTKEGNDENATVIFDDGYRKGYLNFVISKYSSTTYLMHPLNKLNVYYENNLIKSKYTKNDDGDYVSGLDIKTKENKNVYAMDSGEVVDVVSSPKDTGTYGVRIIIKSNGNDYYFTYAHLKEGSLKVKKGDLVYKGQVIAKTGRTATKQKNLKNPVLYVGMTYKYENTYYPVLISNFINKDNSYIRINEYNYKTYQKTR